MAYDNDNHYNNNDREGQYYGRPNNGEGRNNDSIYSKRVKAGKRRTYFFDVRETRGKDYFITITESKKRFDDGGYDRHKMFLYKEDFHKFLDGLQEVVNYVKTDLMPDFDFDAFSHEYDEDGSYVYRAATAPAESYDTVVTKASETYYAESAPGAESQDAGMFSADKAVTDTSYAPDNAEVESWNA